MFNCGMENGGGRVAVNGWGLLVLYGLKGWVRYAA